MTQRTSASVICPTLWLNLSNDYSDYSDYGQRLWLATMTRKSYLWIPGHFYADF